MCELDLFGLCFSLALCVLLWVNAWQMHRVAIAPSDAVHVPHLVAAICGSFREDGLLNISGLSWQILMYACIPILLVWHWSGMCSPAFALALLLGKVVLVLLIVMNIGVLIARRHR